MAAIAIGLQIYPPPPTPWCEKRHEAIIHHIRGLIRPPHTQGCSSSSGHHAGPSWCCYSLHLASYCRRCACRYCCHCLWYCSKNEAPPRMRAWSWVWAAALKVGSRATSDAIGCFGICLAFGICPDAPAAPRCVLIHILVMTRYCHAS